MDRALLRMQLGQTHKSLSTGLLMQVTESENPASVPVPVRFGIRGLPKGVGLHRSDNSGT
jgi:hypothetical protein